MIRYFIISVLFLAGCGMEITQKTDSYTYCRDNQKTFVTVLYHPLTGLKSQEIESKTGLPCSKVQVKAATPKKDDQNW